MIPANPVVISHDRFAIIIPVYNHEKTVNRVVKEALSLGFPVWVVDDGSSDATYDQIKTVEGIHILRHTVNQGKGAAILTGMTAASKSVDWAITLDADGQHQPNDAKNLIAAIQPGQRPIVIGSRQCMEEAKAPWTSRFGRSFSNFWVRASGGPAVTDSQSGFRLYPLPESLQLNVASRRYQFEVEILVKAFWRRWHVVEAPVSVSYHPGTPRISHFHPWIDFFRNTVVFSRLIIYRIFTLKFLNARK